MVEAKVYKRQQGTAGAQCLWETRYFSSALAHSEKHVTDRLNRYEHLLRRVCCTAPSTTVNTLSPTHFVRSHLSLGRRKSQAASGAGSAAASAPEPAVPKASRSCSSIAVRTTAASSSSTTCQVLVPGTGATGPGAAAASAGQPEEQGLPEFSASTWALIGLLAASAAYCRQKEKCTAATNALATLLHGTVGLLPASLQAAAVKAMPKKQRRAGATPAAEVSPLQGHMVVLAALVAATGRPCFAELCWETAATVEKELFSRSCSTVMAPAALGSIGALKVRCNRQQRKTVPQTQFCPEALGVQPPRGLKKARRLDPELRAELAQGAGANTKRRKSAGDAVEDRKRAAAAMPAASIASFDRRRPAEQQAHLLGQYLAEACQRLQSSVITVTVDGSRVGQEGILVLAAWSPEDRFSMWLPPQVRALVAAALDFLLPVYPVCT